VLVHDPTGRSSQQCLTEFANGPPNTRGVIASGAGPLGHAVACEEATTATMVYVTVPVGPQKMQPFGVADLKI
jgi:hypothetical protein